TLLGSIKYEDYFVCAVGHKWMRSIRQALFSAVGLVVVLIMVAVLCGVVYLANRTAKKAAEREAYNKRLLKQRYKLKQRQWQLRGRHSAGSHSKPSSWALG